MDNITDVDTFVLYRDIWEADWFTGLSKNARVLFLYLLTRSESPDKKTKYAINDIHRATSLENEVILDYIKQLHFLWLVNCEFYHRDDKYLKLSISPDYYAGYPLRVQNAQGIRNELTPEQKYKIHQRDRFTCVYCGARSGEIDHVLPISRGGTNDEANLVAACIPCNRKKSDRLLSELGWRINVDTMEF